MPLFNQEQHGFSNIQINDYDQINSSITGNIDKLLTTCKYYKGFWIFTMRTSIGNQDKWKDWWTVKISLKHSLQEITGWFIWDFGHFCNRYTTSRPSRPHKRNKHNEKGFRLPMKNVYNWKELAKHISS